MRCIDKNVIFGKAERTVPVFAPLAKFYIYRCRNVGLFTAPKTVKIWDFTHRPTFVQRRVELSCVAINGAAE